ncbi:MAG: hypothetical protein AAGD25_14665 [Cyanobacteria bacterium P01_F01_bin.150]
MTSPKYLEPLFTDLLFVAYTRILDFLQQPNYQEHLSLAFGSSTTMPLTADTLIPLLDDLPDVVITSAATLEGANGAYAQATNTIYLAAETLERSPQRALSVLIEEIGHYIDAHLNPVDSVGDEGEIFARLVLNDPLLLQEIDSLKQEDDTTVLRLDQQLITVEQAQRQLYSTSGDSSGDSQKLDLGTRQGTLTIDYESFTIPDRLQLIYEGRVIFDTGFVGTQGRKKFTVGFNGTSTALISRLTANRDVNTRWNFDIGLDACADSTPLAIELISGDLTDTDGDGDCEGQGTFYLGHTDGINRMLRIEGGRLELDQNRLKVIDGTVYSLIGQGDIRRQPLFRGNFDIPFETARSSAFREQGSVNNEFQLGGMDIDFSSIAINKDGFVLGADFQLLEALGVPDYRFTGPDALRVTQNRVALGSSVKFSTPTFKNFSLFGFVPVKEFSDFAIAYDAPRNEVKIQGKLALDLKSKTRVVEEVIADLSGQNFISIKDSKTDLVGKLSVKTDLKFPPKGWGLRQIDLGVDTVKKDISGGAELILPFGGGLRLPGKEGTKLRGDLGFKLPLPPFELNQLGLGVDNLNLPLPQFPSVFFQGFRGSVDNFASSDPDPIQFNGGISLTLGPQIPFGGTDISLLRLDVDGSLDAEKVSASGQLTAIAPAIARGQVSTTLDWNKKSFSANGTFNFLDGLINSQGGFSTNSNFDIKMNGTATVGIPQSFPWIGGAQLAGGNFQFDFTNDNDFSNDYVAGWGQISIQKFGFERTFVAGVKGYFDGEIELIGSKNIPPTNSFIIDAGTDWFLMGADWDNRTSRDVPLLVTQPDGTVLTEADFSAANGVAVVDELSDTNSKVVAVFNPTPGVWDIEVADATSLGNITYSAFEDSIAPTVAVNNILVRDSGSTIDINYAAFDADSTASVQLFYDTDQQGFDGILITDDLIERDGEGQFTWNTEGVATGEYYVYAMVVDENNPPSFSYGATPVAITEAADLAVSHGFSTDDITPGQTFTYSVTVTNTSAIASNGVQLLETLPDNIRFRSSDPRRTRRSGNQLTFNLGTLAGGESRTITLEAVAPTEPDTVIGESLVTSATFDPNAANDVDNFIVSVEPPAPKFPDLQLTRSGSNAPVSLGQSFSYTITVQNTGDAPATDVELTEVLPSEVQLVERTLSQGRSRFSATTGTITATLGTINPGEQVTYQATVNPIAAGALTTRTTVTSEEFDIQIFDNSIIDVRPVVSGSVEPADLSLRKSLVPVDTDNPLVGDDVILRTRLRNQGPGVASQVLVSDRLPPGLQLVDADPSQGTYDPATGIWEVGNIRDDLTATLELTARVQRLGVATSTSEIIAVDQVDPDSTAGNGVAGEDDLVSVLIGQVGTLPKAINFNRGKKGATKKGNKQDNRLVGTGKNDTLKGNGGNDQLLGANGNDRLLGGAGKDVLSGGGKSDRLLGGGGNDRLLGGQGRDFLKGQGKNDVLIGGGGSDILVGGSGKDVLKGGGGKDVFVYNSLADGRDTIKGFQPRLDLIDLSGIFKAPQFAGEMAFDRFDRFVTLKQAGSKVRVQVDRDGNGLGTDTVTLATLNGVSVDQLSPLNFVV